LVWALLHHLARSLVSLRDRWHYCSASAAVQRLLLQLWWACMFVHIASAHVRLRMYVRLPSTVSWLFGAETKKWQ